jgi:hypothetical protein
MSYYSNTNYVIFDVTELDKVDFNPVLEDNPNTVRRSVDGTKTFVNWWGPTPPLFVDNLTTKSRIYKYAEILDVLQGPEWTKKIEL